MPLFHDKVPPTRKDLALAFALFLAFWAAYITAVHVGEKNLEARVAEAAEQQR